MFCEICQFIALYAKKQAKMTNIYQRHYEMQYSKSTFSKIPNLPLKHMSEASMKINMLCGLFRKQNI